MEDQKRKDSKSDLRRGVGSSKSTLASLRKVLALLNSGEKRRLIVLFILMIISSVLEVLGVGVLPGFLLILGSPESVEKYRLLKQIFDAFGLETYMQILIFSMVVVFCVFVIKNLFMLFYSYFAASFVRDVQVNLAQRLFVKYLSLDYLDFLGFNASVLQRNVLRETRNVTQLVMINVLRFCLDVIIMVSVFVLLVSIEPGITVLVFSVLGAVSFIFMRQVRGRLRKHGLVEQASRAALIKNVNEGFGGFRENRIFGTESFFIRRFRKQNKISSEALKFKDFTTKIIKPFIETISVFALLAVTLILFLRGNSAEEIIAILALFASASLRLMPAFREIITSWTDIKYSIFSVDPVYRDLVEAPVPSDQPRTREGKFSFREAVTLDGVSFRYPTKDRDAISDVNLTIRKGTVVGFVGQSGAGKSTLIDLIIGLMQPTKGRILIDGTNLDDIRHMWRGVIGYIPQNVYLINDSIRRNVAWGVDEGTIDDERVQTVLKWVGLDDFVRSMPSGIDAEIGERGVNISGGQKQRLGIARALYHNPDVLIMDEATSSLDSISERWIMEFVNSIRGKITVLIIAHKLNSLKECDDIVVVKDGRITSSGSYVELCEQNEDFNLLLNAAG